MKALPRVNYIKAHGDSIVRSTMGTNLFPSVMMAQAVLESRNGDSLLSKKYNNHFGIKAIGKWKGAAVNLDSGEVVNGQSIVQNSAFRVYDSALASFKDRNKFLIENPRYERNGVFKASTPEEQAFALQRAGYATDPNYAHSIISIINTYGLKELDKKKSTGSLPLQ